MLGFVDVSGSRLGLRKITRKFDVVSGLRVGVLAVWAWLVWVCWLVCVSYLLDQS